MINNNYLNPVYSTFNLHCKRVKWIQFGINNFYFLFVIYNLLFYCVASDGSNRGASAALVIMQFLFLYAHVIYSKPLAGNKYLIKKMCEISLPLLPHSLSGWVMSMVDRVLLNNMKNAASAGLFNIGFQFANILNIITVAINQAYAPWFLDQMNSEQGKRKITQAAHVIVVFYSFIALGISFFSPEFMFLFLERSYLKVGLIRLCLHSFSRCIYVVATLWFLRKLFFPS